MFLGEYSHTVDSKGRVFIPAKYRDELGSKFVITKGTDKCLSVYPMEYWNAYVAKIEALPTAQAAKIRRFFSLRRAMWSRIRRVAHFSLKACATTLK